MAPDASEVHRLTHFLDVGLWRTPQHLATLGFHRQNLLAQELGRRVHTQHAPTQTSRERGAIPQPQRSEWLRQLAQARRIPWLLSNPLMRVVVLALSCFR